MADAKSDRITIINQKEGKLVLPPDADELKKNPAAKVRVVMSGQSIEVSAEEGRRLLAHRGVVDASKIVVSGRAQVADLEKQLAEAKAENEKLRKAADAKGGKAAKDKDA